MSNLMKIEKAIFYSFFFGIMALVLFAPEFAMAAAGDKNLANMLKDGNVVKIITFGLAILAAWKWFEYFANFSPAGAFLAIVTPAILTFLAFQWQTVLGWFGIL